MILFRKFILCGAALMAILMGSTPALAQPIQSSTPVSSAQVALCKQSNGENSIAACTAAIESGQWKGDDLSWLHYSRGTTYDGMKRHALAIADYQKALLLKTDNNEARYNRTVACNFLSQVAASATQADAEAFNICGIAYGTAGQYPRALEAYDNAIRLKPDYAEAYLNRGGTYRNTNKEDLALRDMEKALSLSASDIVMQARVYRVRANLYANKPDYARAVQDFDQALKLEPNAFGTLNAVCWTRAQWGQELDIALTQCNESLRLLAERGDTVNGVKVTPEQSARIRAMVLDSRALVHFRRGDYAAAIGDYDEAIKGDATLSGSFYVRGLAKIKSGDKAGGEADIARAKKISSGVDKRFAAFGVKP